MKEFQKPEVEIVEFSNEDIIRTSDGPCTDYVCPSGYGNECETNHVVHP